MGMIFLLIAPAWAGMPMFLLTDIAEQRLEAISFFGVVLLVAAALIRLLWNHLTPLPKLSYLRALGLTVLWGLLFHLVLTMISGARELMTPGAWKKQGATYVLSSQVDPGTAQHAAQTHKLEALRTALWQYGSTHEGQLPSSIFDEEIEPALWRSPHPSGLRYIYVPGRMIDQGQDVIAFEPGVYGAQRLVLHSDGSILSRPLSSIMAAQ